MSRADLKAVDLFSGAGGFSEGLRMAGFEVLGAVDSWAPAVESYRRNFDHPILQMDLAETDGGTLRRALGLGETTIDVVVGGPPCQGFSIQRIGEDHDQRNHLVLEFGRLVRELNPRVFVMENVPGMLGKRGRALTEAFRQQILAEGYDLYSVRVNAADYGVPQTRRRVFFCGWRRDEVAPVPFPGPTHGEDEWVTVEEAIGDLPSPPEDHTPIPGDALHYRTRLSSKNLRRLAHIPPGEGFEALPIDLRAACHKSGAERIGHRNVYGRLAPDEPAGTITARFDSFTRGKFAHPREDRNISLREGARLQTFPDTFEFDGTQEQIAALIGNAVPPRLAGHVGQALASHLNGEKVGGLDPGSLTRDGGQLGLFVAQAVD